MNGRKWSVISLLSALALLVLIGTVTAVIDPMFHYHAPLNAISYRLSNEWYQNDGIVRNFDYDSIITGTSMTENFKTSEFDDFFDAKAVKVSFSGGSFRDVNQCLEQAFKGRDDIKYVVRSMDSYKFTMDKDARGYEQYPEYLYDDRMLNDVNYLLNKSILCGYTLSDIRRTLEGKSSTSFDQYANWMATYTFGKQAVIASEPRTEKRAGVQTLTDKDQAAIQGNISQNVTALAHAHPETTFYLFLPPYSVYYWDSLHQDGSLEKQLQADEVAIQMLLSCENIRLFSFQDDFDLVTDFDQYKDWRHYGEEVNTRILQDMRAGVHQLTLDNYQAYCDRVRAFYTSYDYDSLYA